MKLGEPTRQFVTAVETQRATASDEAGMEAVLAVQAAAGRERPSELYVDGAYVSATAIVAARAQGWKLPGPWQPSASTGPGYRAKSLWWTSRRTATCPGGEASTHGSRLEEAASGKVKYRLEWSWKCRECAQRDACVGRNQPQRSLVVGEHHDALQARRQEMQTDAFTGLMNRRAAIEGTISELVRGHGLREGALSRVAKSGDTELADRRGVQCEACLAAAVGVGAGRRGGVIRRAKACWSECRASRAGKHAPGRRPGEVFEAGGAKSNTDFSARGFFSEIKC